ncbi:MAG: hypothetical protein ABIW81_05680 [Terrimesophilobacter sp.]
MNDISEEPMVGCEPTTLDVSVVPGYAARRFQADVNELSVHNDDHVRLMR